MKLIAALIKFYLIAVLFAYALAYATGAGTYLVLNAPQQQEDTNVYRPS